MRYYYVVKKMQSIFVDIIWLPFEFMIISFKELMNACDVGCSLFSGRFWANWKIKECTGWLVYGGPEKTKDIVKVMPPINKLPYKILDSISLAIQKYPDLLWSASHTVDMS